MLLTILAYGMIIIFMYVIIEKEIVTVYIFSNYSSILL